MAKKSFNTNKRSQPMSEIIKDYEANDKTLDVVKALDNNPTYDNLEKVREAVSVDGQISGDKKEIFDLIKNKFLIAFGENTNLPDNYTLLKE